MTPIDQVFVLTGADGCAEWHVFCGGMVVPAEFNSRGAALAGLATEQRRQAMLRAFTAPGLLGAMALIPEEL